MLLQIGPAVFTNRAAFAIANWGNSIANRDKINLNLASYYKSVDNSFKHIFVRKMLAVNEKLKLMEGVMKSFSKKVTGA